MHIEWLNTSANLNFYEVLLCSGWTNFVIGTCPLVFSSSVLIVGFKLVITGLRQILMFTTANHRFIIGDPNAFGAQENSGPTTVHMEIQGQLSRFFNSKKEKMQAWLFVLFSRGMQNCMKSNIDKMSQYYAVFLFSPWYILGAPWTLCTEVTYLATQ